MSKNQPELATIKRVIFVICMYILFWVLFGIILGITTQNWNALIAVLILLGAGTLLGFSTWVSTKLFK